MKALLTVCTVLATHSDVAGCLGHAVPLNQKILQATMSLPLVRQVWEARAMTSLHAFTDQQQNEKQGTSALGRKVRWRPKRPSQAGFWQPRSLRPSQSLLHRTPLLQFSVRANLLLPQHVQTADIVLGMTRGRPQSVGPRHRWPAVPWDTSAACLVRNDCQRQLWRTGF